MIIKLKCKRSANWLVETACIFLIFSIATVQISMECGMQESLARYKKHLNLHYIYSRVDQQLIVLKLDSVSTNKNLLIGFLTVKVSQNLNIVENMSIQWNQQFSRYLFSKVIKCLEQKIGGQICFKRSSNTKQMNRVQNIWIELRKYGSTCSFCF